MSDTNRRRAGRVPVRLFLNEMNDQRSGRCLALNLSEEGMYIDRLSGQSVGPRVVDLEFALPGCEETIWARGDIRYEQSDKYFHGTGIRFTSISQRHRDLIRNFVAAYRIRQLRHLRSAVQRNRLN